MCENRENIMNACKALFEGLDSNRQAEVSAQLFLEYCVYQDQCENTKRLAPLINTVAEALAIQSVPKDFSLPPDMSLSKMFKAIGNGVPYLASYMIAHVIRDFLEVNREDHG